MFENLKLYHKGLLLVSVPLAFELLFIGLLAVALQQADRAIQAEAHARAVSDQLAMMQRHHFEAVSALGSYGVSRNPTFLSGFEVGIELIKSDLANLKRLTSLNTQQSEEFVKVEKIVQVELARSSEIKSMLANRQSVELIASFKSLKKIMGALSAHLDAIGEQEKRSLQTGPVVRSQMRQHI
jgi:CHASE3 domain sensor protein